MSNPTTPFNWQMPTSTDLVTDLPADFEVFGQAVASSMADLLGGTTGQVLSKATNTDMDFTWVSPNPGDITAVNVTSPITGGGSSGDVTIGIQAGSTTQSGAVQLTDSTSSTSTTTAATPNAVKTSYDLANAAIPKSLVDAKGDIIAATADNTPARLAVGATNGMTLQVDSSTATGLKWATPTTASSGLTFISRTSISAQSSVTFDNVFSTTYENYMIVFQGFFSDTSTPFVQFQWRKSGPSTHSSGYYGAVGLISYNGATSSMNSNATANWQILKINGGSDAGAVMQCQIAGTKGCGAVINTNDNGNGIGYAGYGALSTAPMTAIGFILTTSANNMTGTVTVYGLAKA